MPDIDVPIIMYHCINTQLDASPLGFLGFTPVEFREHLSYFRRNGFSCVTLPELWALAESGELSNRRVVVLTFDDGYLDNLHVVADLLEEFGAKGTVFVTLDFVEVGEVRAVADAPGAWGYLNEAELRYLDQRGTLDIQCHTMTHDSVFVSDRVIDFYDPANASSYHWLPWHIDKASKPSWMSDLAKHYQKITLGYPIFEYDRAIPSRQFQPSDDFIERAAKLFARRGRDCLAEVNALENKGSFESGDQWRERVGYELTESKMRLETMLDKRVDFLCFPGGGYTDECVQIAEKCGYKAYMLASKQRKSGNPQRIMDAITSGRMAGLSRLSVTRDYPSIVRGRLAAYWSCKFAVESYLGGRSAKWATGLAKSARGVLRAIAGRRS
jgi:poly-beta-1,6-N-acetyl-D-glucosamine N-deacetylase